MSRILGLMRRDRAPADSALAVRMMSTIRHGATDGPRTCVSDPASLAYQCLQTTCGPDDYQPVTLPPGISLVFDGRLDNRDELISLVSGELPRQANELSDASLVLACYRRFGESFAKHLNGDYALALYDSREKCLLLARDVIGMRPLYYWASRDLVIACSEIKGILAHPEVKARPDDVAIADQVVGGDPNEARLTGFQNVLRVLPGRTVIVTPERVREVRHWDFDPMRQIRLSTPLEYAEALRALFEQAVRRRIRGQKKVGISVSGGLDSSAVLCQIEVLRQTTAQVPPVTGISMIFPDGTTSDEKQFLEDIENQYGVEIRRLMYSSFSFAADERWLWQFEYPRLRWNAELECLQLTRDLGCSVVLDGQYGDQMMASDAYFFDLARSFRWITLRNKLRALAASMTDSPPALLRNELFSMFLRDSIPDWLMRPIRALRRATGRDGTPRWFNESLLRVGYERSQQQRRPRGPFATKHAELCYRHFAYPFHLRAREEAKKMSDAFGLDRASPFMDRDLVEFIMAIPSEIVNLNGIFKGLFREAMRGVLPESIRLRYWKADFTAPNGGAALASYDRIANYLNSESLAVSFGYLDRDKLAEALAQHRAKITGEFLGPISQFNVVFALELWLRAFFDPSDQREGYSSGNPCPEVAFTIPDVSVSSA